MMRQGAVLGLLAALAFAGVAYAEDPPPFTGDPTWAARGLLGYSKTTGNTDTTTGNFLFHAAKLVGNDWKFLFGAEGLYGSNHGETTAQAWDAHLQANYNLTDRLFVYGSGRYDDDRFSGFAYQASLSTGVGYQFIKTDATKLSGQVGVGARRLETELLVKDDVGGVISRTKLDTSTDTVLDAAANFEHNFNPSTKILAAVTMQSGSDNTLTTGMVGLQVKMTGTLSLAAGWQTTNNSKPPPGSGKRDSLTTLSVVYELKNPKLAPE